MWIFQIIFRHISALQERNERHPAQIGFIADAKVDTLRLDRRGIHKNRVHLDDGITGIAHHAISIQRIGIDHGLEVLGDDHWIIAVGDSIRGDVLLKLGRMGEAEPLLISSYERLVASPGARQVYVRRALARVVELYSTSDREELADEYRGRLAAIELQRLDD